MIHLTHREQSSEEFRNGVALLAGAPDVSSINELDTCIFEVLVDDGELVISRAYSADRSSSWLVTSPALHRPLTGLAKLQHAYSLRGELDFPGSARPLELTEFHGQPTLLTEDPGGHFLSELTGRPLAVKESLRLAIGIVRGLGELHRRGLVHKDVKPSNLLVNVNTGRAYLTGFGIASRLSRHRQLPDPVEEIAGTLAYMAPEQTGRMGRSIDSRSDLYSFGVTLYEMVVGTPPFAANDPMEWIHCHIARSPAPPIASGIDIPEPLSAIIMKLLTKAPEERYQTAAGVEADLLRCLTAWEGGGRIVLFSLGIYDMSDQLLISEKLYGRESEVERLLASFDRVVTSGRAELVLVAGYSGVGKSSVVNELHQALVPPRGLFASGKFDQFQRDIPYATITQAFRKLVGHVLSRSDAEMCYWRDSFREALGQNGQLIVNLIPELELVTGRQPSVPELPPQEAQSRFQTIFRRFLGVFARAEHPLALFLDDLQWLDVATLRLLEHLMTEPDVRHLLLLGAYRDNEVDASHPLTQTVETIVGAGAIVQQMVLTALTPENVVQLVADSLHCGRERAVPLAYLIYEKTGGNPFFTNQFVSTLAEEGLVVFNSEAAAWQWNLPRINEKGFTDNVIDLMAGKLDRLPEKTQHAMSLMACLGNVAEEASLVLIYGESDDHLQTALWEAMRVGLVLRSDTGYAFLHDRVQEAAYQLIPLGKRAKTHLKIGRLLASQTAIHEVKEKIFELANQFNRGGLLQSPEERLQVAEFNLEAGKRAKTSAAYASALTYLTAGRALLAATSWEHDYRLTFDLEFHRAECELLIGDLSGAEERLALLSKKAGNILDGASVARLRADLYTNMDKPERAVEIGLEDLRLIGVTWSAHPTDEEVSEEYEHIWQRLGNRSVEELRELPSMVDPVCRGTLDVLTSVHAPANFTDRNLVSLIIGRMANLSLEHGNAAGSCFAYVYLGMILESRFGDFRRGVSFGKLGVSLLEKEGLDRFRARVYNNFGMAINPWASHVQSSVELLRRANDIARETGDLTFMGYSFTNLISALLIAGNPLGDVQREAEAALAFLQRVQFGTVADMVVTQLNLVRALRGLTSDLSSFNHAEFEESKFEQHLDGDPALSMTTCWYWIRKMQAFYLSGSLAAAAEAATKAEAFLWTSPNFIVIADHHFYAALVRLAQYETALPEERDCIWTMSETHRKMLAVWAEHCPENFANRFSLVEAEVARIEGRQLDAMRFYERAVQSAREHGFVQNVGLASELAARFYAAQGFESIADAKLRHARDCYLRWGASGKVGQLDRLYPHLRDKLPSPAAATSIETQVENLDLATVVKISQAVSGELVLDKLIEKLMTIAVEHAGAGRGLLILIRNGQPQIEAEATTRLDSIAVSVRPAAVTPAELPESILNYVIRTRESVSLVDASVRNTYSGDAYLGQTRARSVLCLPIVKQTKLVGALYLENNLASHVFTEERVDVLDLLTSQAAISLENARLYADLERENVERRRVEEDLRRSERLMSEGQRIGRTGSWAWNIQTGKLTWSREQKLIFGFPAEIADLAFEDFLASIHPEDRATVMQTVEAATVVGSSFDHEFRIVLSDGAIKFIHGSGRPVFDESGAVVEYFGAVLDITDRKHSENELTRNAAFLAHAQRVTSTGSLWWNVPTGEIIWSDEGYRVLEYPRTVTPSVDLILNRVHPNDRPLVEEMVSRAARDGTNMDSKHRLLMPDGSIKHVRVIIQNVTLDSGERQFVGAVTEITEQQKLEDDLAVALARVTESKDQLRTLIDTMPCHAWTSDPRGGGEFFSRRWLDYAGMSWEEVQGPGWARAIHPDDVGPMLETWQKIIATKKHGELEARLRRYNGEYRWFLFLAAPLLDASGEVIKWYGTNVDIDGLKRAETFLAGEKHLFEMISTDKPLEAILETLCRVVEELAEGSLASILLMDENGKRLRHCSSPSLPVSYTDAVNGALIGPSTGSCGTAAYRGEKVYVSDIATDPLWAEYRELALKHDLRACWSNPILATNGTVIGSFALYSNHVREITPTEERIIEQFTHLARIVIERKRAADALRKSEALLAQAQSIAHVGYWDYDLETEIVTRSKETWRICGLAEGEGAIALPQLLESIHPEDRSSVLQAFQHAIQRKASYDSEYRVVRPSGEVRFVHCTGEPVGDESGPVRRMFGTVQDITERKLTEEELRRSEERLTKARAELAHVSRTTTMGELAASIAHEVNQPLTGIVMGGNAGLRWLNADGPNLDEARGAMERVVRDGKRAGEVIARIRKLFRKDAPNREALEINEVIQEVIVLTRSELHKNGIVFHLNLGTDIPFVLGDRVQLQQVLMNLILNAVDAMSSVEIASRQLTISTVHDAGGHVRVEVQDNGPGIDAEEADRIFEPFHTTKSGGMGMGLSICRTIMEDHGGRLCVVPHDGPGAKFQFTLPKDR